MFIVTVKSIDADSFALPTLYGKTTLQNYNFSMNPQGMRENLFPLDREAPFCLEKNVLPSMWVLCGFYMPSMCLLCG